MNLIKSTQSKLLNYLRDNPGFHTAAELAIEIGKSKRTVKNYIQDLKINYQIISGREGYKFLQTKKDYYDLNSFSNQKNKLLNELINSSTPLNIYDLAENFYVSESVIKRTVKELQTKVAHFNLKIMYKNDSLCLIGSEQDRRHLISSLLYNEISGTFLNEDVLKNNFPQIDVSSIFKIVVHEAEKEKIYLNTFDLNNIVLHILISVERLQQGYKIKNGIGISSSKQGYDFATKILNQIEDQLKNVHFDFSDRQELKTIINSSASRKDKSFDNYLSSQTKYLLCQIVKYIKEVYSIDLSHSKFLKQFGLHLERLIVRLKSKQIVHNPLAESIKMSSPTIYECAVLISHLISEECNIIVPDNEIAFIALHIGNAVSEQISSNNKIKVILLAPEYQENIVQIVSKIEKHFSEQMVIIDIVQNFSSIEDQDADLIVSLNGSTDNQVKTISVSQFLTFKDLDKVGKAITEVKATIKKKQFLHDAGNFFRPEFFLYNKGLKKRDQILAYVVEGFSKENVTTKEYFSRLINRERMSSTAFGRVAIPHSFDMIAQKSRGFVVINPSGVQWDNDNKVYLVIVLAVASDDKKIFRNIFDKISNVMVDSKNIEELVNCKDYKDFIEKLTDLIEQTDF
ncbi:BglG family transcription antiterminator [Liquorilactobacillus sicerae]|uniref:BglG family transcription antiterminator n=1 Tax=Liquorilactobacillus sicerae TaxID=1416943 RepID=UPI002481106F|nr:PTS sugar transporter subunit IIA [Liquorilactobacillus sicerae]